MHIEASIDRVRAFAQAKGWGVYRLAKEAGLSPQACMKMYDEDWSPRADTLRKLELLIASDSNAHSSNGTPDAAISL